MQIRNTELRITYVNFPMHQIEIMKASNVSRNSIIIKPKAVKSPIPFLVSIGLELRVIIVWLTFLCNNFFLALGFIVIWRQRSFPILVFFSCRTFKHLPLLPIICHNIINCASRWYCNNNIINVKLRSVSMVSKHIIY